MLSADVLNSSSSIPDQPASTEEPDGARDGTKASSDKQVVLDIPPPSEVHVEHSEEWTGRLVAFDKDGLVKWATIFAFGNRHMTWLRHLHVDTVVDVRQSGHAAMVCKTYTCWYPAGPCP